MSRFIRAVITALILLPLLARSTPALSPSDVRHWREDIEVLKTQLEKHHINLYHSVDRHQFGHALASLQKKLPELDSDQVLVELMRAVRLVGDGHTQLSYWGGPHTHYPIDLQMFGDDLRLIATTAEQRRYLGMKLSSIDGQPIETVVAALKPVLLGVENQYSERHRLTETLPVAEVLSGLGITENRREATFGFISDSGTQHSVRLASLEPSVASAVVTSKLDRVLPAGFEKHDVSLAGLALYLDQTRSLAYIDFDDYPRHSQMERFASELERVFERAGIRNLVIDLRHNGGGDFFVGLTLAWGLVVIDGLDWEEGIYVLTGGETFSAAMSNAAQYRQILNAKLVGMPTGANPVGYQDADTFTLPNSGWMVMYSKRFYRFQDVATPGVQPDVWVAPDWRSFKAGRDNQLAWVLEDVDARLEETAQ